jgi:UDP-GlcNAc3NAcA epimerase
MRGLEPYLMERRPDLVLVYGDTNSTLAAALVAAKLNIPIAHVEAGLRSRNMRMPEEINRIVVDKLSALLFTGTDAARQNLVVEGLAAKSHDVGDVMLDCIRLYQERAGDLITRLVPFGLKRASYALATIHRAENTDSAERLAGIMEGLRNLSRTLTVVLPLHPRTAAVLEQLGNQGVAGVRIILPVSYFDMLILERGARLILTDSGGVQKEAYCHGIPCVTLRDETEWVETVASGWNRLAKPQPAAIWAAASAMLSFDRMQTRPAFYGDGHAADAIVDCLLRWHRSVAR